VSVATSQGLTTGLKKRHRAPRALKLRAAPFAGKWTSQPEAPASDAHGHSPPVGLRFRLLEPPRWHQRRNVKTCACDHYSSCGAAWRVATVSEIRMYPFVSEAFSAGGHWPDSFGRFAASSPGQRDSCRPERGRPGHCRNSATEPRKMGQSAGEPRQKKVVGWASEPVPRGANGFKRSLAGYHHW